MRRRLLKPAILLGCLLILSIKAVNAADQSRLTTMVRTVLENHPSVLAVRAKLDAAEARQSAADQPLYNPDLDIEYEDTGDITTKALELRQSIDWGNKRAIRTRMAALAREGVAVEWSGIRQDLATELLTALAAYHTAAELASLARQRRALMQRFLELTEQRRQAGDLGQVALDLAKLAHIEATLQRTRSAVNQAQTEQTLLAVADNQQKPWPVLPAIPSPSLLDTKNIDALLEQHPALRIARTQIAIARTSVNLHRRERKADPTIGLRGGREASNNLIGLNLSIPLFVRNNFSAEVEAANANAIQVEQLAHNSYRRHRAKLISTARRYELGYQTWVEWLQTGRTSLDSQIQLLERLWRVGELSTADYLVQLKQTLDTRTAAAMLRGSLWQTWFEWLATSGNTESWLRLKNEGAE